MIVGVLATPVALILAIASAGGGHGHYLLARVLFPLSMLSIHLYEKIAAPAIWLACAQFPIYGCLVGLAFSKQRWVFVAWVVAAFHALMLVLIFVFPNQYFS